MSHLRAPAARADRREGGRHGKPLARAATSLPETHIRPQLLRLAVLPPIAVALSASAAVLFTVRSTAARPGLTLWAVLGGALAVALAAIVIAAVAANRAARSVRDRVDALRRASAARQADLPALVEALRRGDAPPARRPPSQPAPDADEFDLLAEDLARAHEGAVGAVVQASRLSSHAGSEQKVEVFVNLARRLQSLVQREIAILDELENEIEDPDVLKGLFHVDHLATRIRRHAENLAVLGGAVSRRQWSNPVSMTEVLRSATAEVEQYQRVKLVPPIDGTVRGHAVADVIHLLAELVENATVFSSPHTQVLLRVNVVTSGLAVEVEDRGLGMPLDEQDKMNALLADPDQVNVASLLQDGRIGLFVVSQLARRHGIAVRLQTNIYGGVQAVLVVPQDLLGAAQEREQEPEQDQQRQSVAGRQQKGVAQTGTPADGVPAYGTSAQGIPAQATPAQATPAQATPAQATPAQATPAQSTPAQGTPAHGAPAVTPRAKGTPVPHGASALGPVTTANAHHGTRPAVPRQQQRDDVPDRRSGASGSAPLPVRGAEARPNPAEALPGIRPEHRWVVTENMGASPTPRNSAVRGTIGKPQLPKRRAQEHIVPELREGPVPRPESEILVGHDPNLMAAFQRGIGLAEAQQRDAARRDATPIGETETPSAPSHDRTARHDGSPPAG
ncbi:sensor histidine kinase [Streptomyces sporangiiformans]|uniref:histidine kinase n=1 Tax=Streptomyces sporangiiformans TaxID=2315329 RepID=A0A505D423_9ACTN|nr:ATP-binding protein [Streptomyces sporangiiformans]TPQ15538.1 ATP-binding protein [Streptomyces sporangiiformans]